MKLIAPLSALILALATPAWAQQSPDAEAVPESEQQPKVRYQAVTEITGDDLSVTGGLSGPSGATVNLRREQQFRPLIRLREHFDREMQESANQVR